MSVSHLSPVAVPAQWVLNILDLSVNEFLDTITTADYLDIGSILLIMELSRNENHVMSAIISTSHILNTGLDIDNQLKEGIQHIKPQRWEDMFTMTPIVAREVVRLMGYLDATPTLILHHIAAHVSNNDMICNAVADLWITKGWDITLDFVLMIKTSYYGWKYLHAFNKGDSTSQTIIQSIIDASTDNPSIWMSHFGLIGINGSALEYIMYLDELNANGMVSTIATIDEFALWDTVMNNPAVGPIIDYIFENASDDHDAARGWIIPLICKNQIVSKYITTCDIQAGRVNASIFVNPNAIDVIDQWVQQTKLTQVIIDGLVNIATVHNRDVAEKAVRILDKGNALLDLPNNQISDLLLSYYAKQPTIDAFNARGMGVIASELLYENRCIPYWSVDDNGEWYIENLSDDTLANVDLQFYNELNESAYLLSHADWIILLNTKKGVELGLKHVLRVIDSGVLFALLMSPYITKDHLIELNATTETFEYCDDEDFMALVNKPDIYDSDLRCVYTINHHMCLELLRVWYHPDRIIEAAKRSNLNPREYLELYE